MTAPDIFSIEDCQKILQNCFGKPIKYNSHLFKSLIGDVEGYLSEHYSLEIFYGDENKSRKFFVKAILQTESFLAEFSKAMDVFHKESFMYTKFFPELERYDLKQIYPKCYLCKPNVIVMEDLSLDGFKPGERLKMYNFEQCKIAIETLAYYHAYGFLYEELKSGNSAIRLDELFPAEFEDRFYGENSSSPTKKFLESSLKSLMDLIEAIPEENLKNKEYFQKVLIQNFTDVEREEKYENKYRRTCSHGDLWANNIMFKYNDDNTKIIDCKLIDFQLLTYNPPGYDIELLFYGNTTSTFRAEHKHELLIHYYDYLSKILSNNNVEISNIISFEDLEGCCIFRGPEAKVQAICDMSLLFLPEEEKERGFENPDHFKTVLIDERSRYILNIYNNNEAFKKIIDEEFVDLLYILEKKEKLLNNNL